MRGITYFNNRKSLSKVFICLIFISSFSTKNFAQTEQEWYLIFALGLKPNRVAYFLDMKSVKVLANNVHSVNFAFVAENKENPRFSRYTVEKLEYRCKTDEMRIAGGAKYTYEKTSVPMQATSWGKVENAKHEYKIFKKLVCNIDTFNAARSFANKDGEINNDTLYSLLLAQNLTDKPLPLLTHWAVTDFEDLLETLWSEFWKTTPPDRNATQKRSPFVPKSLSPESLVKKAVSLIQKQNYDKAFAYLGEASRIKPNYSDPYFYGGLAYSELGEYDLAIVNYSKVLEIKPNDISSYFNRGLIHFEQKHNFELAEADFNKVIQLNSQYALIYFLRSELYESWGKDNLAVADLQKFKSLGGDKLPGFENRRRRLFPNVKFDSSLASQALQKGNSTIIGKACSYKDGGLIGGGKRFDAANVPVLLVPATPYIEIWYQFREKKENKKTWVSVSREIAKYGIITTTNQKGEFVFKDLRPGKYFLEINFGFTQVKTKRIFLGSETAQVGQEIVTTNYYEDRDYYIDQNDRLESFVEIKKDGDVQKVTIKNRKIGNC